MLCEHRYAKHRWTGHPEDSSIINGVGCRTHHIDSAQRVNIEDRDA